MIQQGDIHISLLMNHRKNQSMAFDDLERRCPRLGSRVRFFYCRTSGQAGAPCFKAIDCWWEIFDAETYFQQQLDPDVFARLVNSPPPNKVASLLELVAQARERLENND